MNRPYLEKQVNRMIRICKRIYFLNLINPQTCLNMNNIAKQKSLEAAKCVIEFFKNNRLSFVVLRERSNRVTELNNEELNNVNLIYGDDE